MGSIGPEKILFVLVVAMVVLGPERLPKVARDIGRFVTRLRELQARLESEVRDVVGDVPEPFLNPRGWLTQQAGSILSAPGDPSSDVAMQADPVGSDDGGPTWVDDRDVQDASSDVGQGVGDGSGLADGWRGRVGSPGLGPGTASGVAGLGAGDIGIIPGDPVLN